MRHIPTLIPTDFWFRTVLVLLIITGVSLFIKFANSAPSMNDGTLEFSLVVFSIIIIGSLFDLYLRRGYRVSYDEGSIYWRKVGLRRSLSSQIVMPYAAISHVFGEPGTLGIKPFEAVVLHAEEQEIPDIILSRMYLRNNDIKHLLESVSNKSGALFEEEVRDFMK